MLSSACGSSSSPTSRMQDMTHNQASQDPAMDRSDGQVSGNGNGTDRERKDTDGRLQLPAWLEDFTDNREDPEIPGPTHISAEDSDSERLSKVVLKSKSKMLRIFSLPKIWKLRRMLAGQDDKAPCRRRAGQASIPRAKKIGDLITTSHKVHNEEGESRNNHLYAVVVQLGTQKTEISLRKFIETSRKSKVFYTGNSLEFGKSSKRRNCEGEVIVQRDEGPVCGVAQVVDCHGVTVGHQEKEEEEEQQEVESVMERTLKERCTWMACG